MWNEPPRDGPPEPPACTDAELIARSGDLPEAFAVLFDRHAAALHRYLARRAGGLIAEDLVAQAFLVAFEQRARYDVRRPDARAWLYGIATNLLRRHHRDEERLLRALARTGVDTTSAHPCPADQIADRLDANAMSQRLAAAIAGLPAVERDVLLLHAWAELDLEEVGRALDIPSGTVRSRLHRARKRLRPLASLMSGAANDHAFTKEELRYG
ncbi:RNA polymerase sigma factor [Micromonospora viridifaciens]|uniref:RNA polymerase sigma factor n=1 Tax=Micromonospora viridifaciens TaxID=1881 RepID=UPI000B5AFEB0|nr:RNA polymerase sigma factor [Micromonospora viridifaciens]